MSAHKKQKNWTSRFPSSDLFSLSISIKVWRRERKTKEKKEKEMHFLGDISIVIEIWQQCSQNLKLDSGRIWNELNHHWTDERYITLRPWFIMPVQQPTFFFFFWILLQESGTRGKWRVKVFFFPFDLCAVFDSQRMRTAAASSFRPASGLRRRSCPADRVQSRILSVRFCHALLRQVRMERNHPHLPR